MAWENVRVGGNERSVAMATCCLPRLSPVQGRLACLAQTFKQQLLAGVNRFHVVSKLITLKLLLCNKYSQITLKMSFEVGFNMS